MVLAQLEDEIRNAAIEKFPSHYGSRSTRILAMKYLQLSRFHPTMVLAQRQQEDKVYPQTPVSIPLWFSLNVRISER